MGQAHGVYEATQTDLSVKPDFHPDLCRRPSISSRDVVRRRENSVFASERDGLETKRNAARERYDDRATRG
jgi:hypothetical protein